MYGIFNDVPYGVLLAVGIGIILIITAATIFVFYFAYKKCCKKSKYENLNLVFNQNKS